MTLQLQNVLDAIVQAGEMIKDFEAGKIQEAEEDAVKFLADFSVTVNAAKLQAEFNIINDLIQAFVTKKESVPQALLDVVRQLQVLV